MIITIKVMSSTIFIGVRSLMRSAGMLKYLKPWGGFWVEFAVDLVLRCAEKLLASVHVLLLLWSMFLLFYEGGLIGYGK